MESILIGVMAFLGFLAYCVVLVTIIVDMCNPDPFMSNWEFIKRCFKE